MLEDILGIIFGFREYKIREIVYCVYSYIVVVWEVGRDLRFLVDNYLWKINLFNFIFVFLGWVDV